MIYAHKFLNEQENSRSPDRQQELLKFLEESVLFFGCQFIISTHSLLFTFHERCEIYDLNEEPMDGASEYWSYYEFFKRREQNL